jgi:hypothetical protein
LFHLQHRLSNFSLLASSSGLVTGSRHGSGNPEGGAGRGFRDAEAFIGTDAKDIASGLPVMSAESGSPQRAHLELLLPESSVARTRATAAAKQ